MLRAREISRNRNFDLFKHPAARRALRLHLMLRQLERDLVDHAQRDAVVRLNGYANGRRVVEIEDSELKLVRRIYLTDDEVSLLLEIPVIANLLGESGERA